MTDEEWLKRNSRTYSDYNDTNQWHWMTYRGRDIRVPSSMWNEHKKNSDTWKNYVAKVHAIIDHQLGDNTSTWGANNESDQKFYEDTGLDILGEKEFWVDAYHKVADAAKNLLGNGTTTRIPSAGSGYAVDSGTVEAPASELDSYDAYLKTLKDISEANNAFNVEQAQKQMDWTSEQNKIMMDFNAAEAQKNRDWQQWMSDTAYQRQTADLQAAGLNPILAINGGNGAPISSGSAAYATGNGSGAKATADTVFASAMLSMFNSAMDVAEKSAEASISANRVAYSNSTSDSKFSLRNIAEFAKDLYPVIRIVRAIL